MKFKRISAAEKIKFDQSSPVFDFENGRSYFAAFEIPDDSSRHFRIKSFFNGMLIGQYFDPIILVMNENYEPITIGSLELKFFEAAPSWDGIAHMLGEFSVDRSAKYVVVLTSKFDTMAPVAVTKPTGYGYMLGSTPVFGTAPSRSIQLKRSPTGSVLIEAIP